MAYGAGTPTAPPPATDAPAMNDPKAAARAKLFRPQFEGETLGKVLKKMLWDGRKVADQERPRWQANRKMYRGEQYLHVSKTGVRSLAPTDKLPNGIRRVTINRMRPMIDARIAMFTYKRPDFEVQTSSQSLQSLEARRVATKLVDACWGHDEWDIDEYNRTALLYAEQDGPVAGCVLYDPTVGRKVTVMVDNATGQIIQDPEMAAAYRETDPAGQFLWTQREMREGTVKPRIVRAANLSVDPFARTDPDMAQWVIESEIMPRHKVEQMAGMKIEELCRRSKTAEGTTMGGGDKAESPSASQFDDSYGPGEQIDSSEALTVRHAFVLPTGAYGRWPVGARISWIDIAPEYPIIMEPWDKNELPYKFFVPRADGGHFMSARAMADDLGPIQVAFNRVVSMLHEWLDLVGRPPLIVQNGVLRTKNVFNEARIVNVNGGQPPFFMPVPSEPTAVFTHHLMFLLEQMKEIAAQHDASRGQAPGKGIEAGVSLDMLIQQNEQTVSPYAEAFRTFLEWTLSRALSEVADNYSLPRLIQGAVGDDPSAFRDFVGERIKGATAVKVVGPLTPRARATQVQMLLELAQYTQGRFDPSRWVTQLLEGNIDEIIEGERAQLQAQKREIDDILALGARPDANQLWMHFQEAEQAYIEVIQRARDAGIAGDNPMQTLRTMRTPSRPPTLANVGIQLPQLTDADNHPMHIMVLDEFVISPAYKHQHPLVKRALKEHRLMHQTAMARQMMAIADQGGGPSGPPTEEPPPGAEGQGGPPDQEGPPE